MRFKFDREFYVPKGSVKVSDKLSDAVAYVSTDLKGKAYAAMFYGKQAKPIFHYSYRTAARRDEAVKAAFESRRASLTFKAENRAKRKAWVNTYKVGDIFSTCWGYDQTNREFFEVIEVKGKHLILREIAQKTVQTGMDSGQCIPLPGQYLKPRYDGDTQGLPIRRLAQEGGVKIDDVRSASLDKPTMVAGVPVYKPSHYSWGH